MKFAVICSLPVMMICSESRVFELSPFQFKKVYPGEAVALSVTMLPVSYVPPAGENETFPPAVERRRLSACMMEPSFVLFRQLNSR